MNTTDVRFWGVRKLPRRISTFEVRWVVAGSVRSRTRRTKALAEAFLGDLRRAARDGEPFDTDTGLPTSMRPVDLGPSWLTFAQQYLGMKWPRAAATSRDSLTDALATISAALVTTVDDQPSAHLLRAALRQHLLPPAARALQPPDDVAAAIDWLQEHSIPLQQLARPAQLRLALDALTLTLDGKPAAATTVNRKRGVQQRPAVRR